MRKKGILKQAIALTLALGISLSGSLVAYAGEWKKDEHEATMYSGYSFVWMYQRDDGTYSKDGWEQIDGKYYYFHVWGDLLIDIITPDGYYVDKNGAWIENFPQIQEVDRTLYRLNYMNLKAYYKGGLYVNEAEFEEEVHRHFEDPVVAEQVINVMRNNNTFVPGVPG